MHRYRIHVNGETEPQTERYASKKEVSDAATRDQLTDGSYSVVDESDEPDEPDEPDETKG